MVHSVGDAHAKTVTAVALSRAADTLLTASFDGFAKVYHTADMSHLWTYKLPGPASCAAWRPDGSAFVVGLDDGQWILRQRRSEGDARAEEAARTLRAKAALPEARKRGHLRGADQKPGVDDEVVESSRPLKRKESQVDFFMRKFDYLKAVEFMMQQSTSSSLGLAVIDELLQRGALGTTFSVLDEDQCFSLLNWLLKVFGSGEVLQSSLLFEALHTLFDHNKHLQPPTSQRLVDAVHKLDNRVSQEMKIQEVLIETSGMLKAVMRS